MRRIALFLVCACLTAEYRVPAGDRAAIRRPGAESILPGGRMISPHGKQFATGPWPFGLAASPSGKMIVSHRTVFLLASPYARKNYVSHVNAGFGAMWKTVFGILGLPPLNLHDAAAADLFDCLTEAADFTPFALQQEHKDLFDPEEARAPAEPPQHPGVLQ